MLIKTYDAQSFNTAKVTAVVRDKAANIMKAVELSFGKKKHFPCVKDTIRIVVQYILGIPEFELIINQCSTMIS